MIFYKVAGTITVEPVNSKFLLQESSKTFYGATDPSSPFIIYFFTSINDIFQITIADLTLFP